MTSQFKLEGPVSATNDVDPADSRKVKQALMRLGHLDRSDVVSLDFVDSPTLEGLKAFQKRNGLVADGIAKPGGPTEGMIAAALAERQGAAQGTAFALSDSVGEKAANRPGDVRKLKHALAATGHFPAAKAQGPTGRIDDDLELGIRSFQRDFNLKRDGVLRPGGEIERTLDRVVKATHPPGPALAQAAPKAPTQTWDKTSDQRIGGLHPKVQGPAAAFVNDVEAQLGIKLRVTWADRPIKDQNTLFKQGRTAPGNIVTNARGGDSYHNYGLAIDVVEMRKGRPNWNTNWRAIGRIGMSHGFQWGGNWKTPDRPHFQMTFGLSIQQLKQGVRPK